MSNSMCPACGDKSLEPIEDRNVSFLGCEACFGLFVSEEALASYCTDSLGQAAANDAFTQLMEKALGDPPRPGRRPCPTCGEGLHRIGFGEAPFMILDRCAEHGVWLDRKELKKCVRAVRSHGRVAGLLESSAGDDDDDE